MCICVRLYSREQDLEGVRAATACREAGLRSPV
jgi:hypothetical protein